MKYIIKSNVEKMVFPRIKSQKGKTISKQRTNSYSYIIQKHQARSSYKERRENDLASGAEEGRDKLR